MYHGLIQRNFGPLRDGYRVRRATSRDKVVNSAFSTPCAKTARESFGLGRVRDIEGEARGRNASTAHHISRTSSQALGSLASKVMHRLFAALCLAAARTNAAMLGPQLAGRLPAGPGRQYFYWLCPARSGDKAAPLLVWLNGGPGSSSMMGLFLENGPYFIADDGLLQTRNASWNNNFDILYVDQPAGTGFSVVQSPDAYATNQEDVAEAFSAFLANFYRAYPDTRTKQLWLTGRATRASIYRRSQHTLSRTEPRSPASRSATG